MAKKISVGDIIPENKIIEEPIIAIILLREGKMKKSRYVKIKSIKEIYLGSNIIITGKELMR